MNERTYFSRRVDVRKAIRMRKLSLDTMSERTGLSKQSIVQFYQGNPGAKKLYLLAERGWGGSATDFFFPCKVTVSEVDGVETENVEWISEEEYQNHLKEMKAEQGGGAEAGKDEGGDDNFCSGNHADNQDSDNGGPADGEEDDEQEESDFLEARGMNGKVRFKKPKHYLCPRCGIHLVEFPLEP